MSKERWILTLGVAAAAGLAARATVTLAGLPLFRLHEIVPRAPDETVEERNIGPPAKPRGAGIASVVAAARAAIHRRNIFCPTCIPVDDVNPNPPADASAALVAAAGGATRSTLNLQLVGTMEGVFPWPSQATVYDADAGVMGLYSEHELIRPGVMLDRIEQGMLLITNAKHPEYIPLGAPPPPAKAGPTNPKPPRPTKPASVLDDADDAIHCSSEDVCVVDRAFVEALLTDPKVLMKQARPVPKTVGGKTGFALYGIRRGSLPKRLGLKNGDVITAINGSDLGSIDDVMALYVKLRRAPRLEVELTRKGKQRTKEIQIR